MVQKGNKDVALEIVIHLLNKGERHLRAMAKGLEFPHATVLRKTNLLIKEGVIDYKTEGRNKVFFLRKTLKAKNYIYMAENYKTNKILEKYPKLGVIMEEVLRETKSSPVVLFGSYAKMRAKSESDIDIYIDSKDKELKKKLWELKHQISLKTGKINLKNNLVKEIIKDHVIFRGVEEFYEQTKFFT